MFKVLASLLVVAISATTISGFSLHAPVNQAHNIFSPFAEINQNHMQNQYAMDAGLLPHPGYPGYFDYPVIPGVPASAYDNVRVNVPVNTQMNLFSPHAQINSNDMQNSVSTAY